MTRATPAYNSRNADKFVVRLPEGMRQRIADVAYANTRSMNSEIVTMLSRALDKRQAWNPTVGCLVVHSTFGAGKIIEFDVSPLPSDTESEFEVFAKVQFGLDFKARIQVYPRLDLKPFFV